MSTPTLRMLPLALLPFAALERYDAGLPGPAPDLPLERTYGITSFELG